jgi:hypothetical protein
MFSMQNDKRLHRQTKNLVNFILYIRNNETTAHVIFVHAYQDAESIPLDVAADIKVLDEAFRTITIDLMFVRGKFGPAVSRYRIFHVECLSGRRGCSTARGSC